MDFREILQSLSNLSEATTTTDKGTIHKAGPGGYGQQHGSEEVTDQYGKPKGKVSLGKLAAQNEPKRGKGRPPNPDKAKSYDSSALSKAMGMGKAPKPTGKPSVKHSLKEYFDQLDQALSEADQIEIKPASQMPKQPGQSSQPGQQQMAGQPQKNTQVIAQGNKTLGTVDNPQLAQQIKQSIGKGEMTLMPEQEMAEDGEKWIQGAIKHPGAFTKKASSHGMTPKEFANKVLAHKADYPAKTEKQAQLAKTLSKMHEAEAPQHFAQSSPISTGGRNPYSLEEGKKGVNPFAKKDESDKKKLPSMAHIKKMCQDGKTVAEICKMHPDCDHKQLKQMIADCKKKLSEGSKPDFLDLDKDGNKKESMKAAAKDKKKVKEGMEHHLQAARLEGKSHALRKMPYSCSHDDMEAARHYHEGFKEGLDECYGQMPILGRTAVGEVSPEVGTMASYGADALGEMDKTSYMKQQAIKTPGDTFKAFGQTMRDSDVLDEFAFESLDKQLNALLESEEKVSEGMTVSISKGQQGTPDSVSVSAQDGEADQLLSIMKSAGMGLFGGEEKGFNAPEGGAGAHGGISVVDDHDGMMALMKKLSGGEMQSAGDFADEEDHSEEGHEHGEEEHSHEGEEDSCNECGYMESQCQCDHDDKEVVDETETEDQMTDEVAEANAPDSGADNTNADVAGNAAANSALATADAGEDEEEGEVYSKPVSEDGDEAETDEEDAEEEVEESIYESYANSADDTFEADIEFMTKIISGGLNKQKSTGQTTIPVIAGQGMRTGVDGKKDIKESAMLNESVNDWKKLAGIK